MPTLLIFSDRFCAVTTISSSPVTSWAAGAIAANTPVRMVKQANDDLYRIILLSPRVKFYLAFLFTKILTQPRESLVHCRIAIINRHSRHTLLRRLHAPHSAPCFRVPDACPAHSLALDYPRGI